MQEKRALVVGLGIAGMSAAIGLRDAGWTPVIIERAAERRSGGYFVGVFPEGKKAAGDLGVLKHLHVRNTTHGTDWNIDQHGRSTPGVGFTDRPGSPYLVMRGDIEAALWRGLQGHHADTEPAQVEVRFSTIPLSITESANEVSVVFLNSATGDEYSEKFDLVVGADGLRSTVRERAFGPHANFMKQWNAIVCAFELDEQVPGYNSQDGIINAQAGRAAWVFAFKDRTPTVLLTYRTKDIDGQFARPPIESLRAAYAGMDHPSITHALKSLETTPNHLFDTANQVHMPTWHTKRVVLVGDAAWCLTLYSGMGASSAMRGGAALGEALRAHPDQLEDALAHWERELRPFISKHRRRARIMQQFFVPSGPIALVVRNTLLRVLTSIKRGKLIRPGRGKAAVPVGPEREWNHAQN